MKKIMFFSDAITIVPHTATHKEHLDKGVTLHQFIGEQSASLHEKENGDLVCKRSDGAFIEGPETK